MLRSRWHAAAAQSGTPDARLQQLERLGCERPHVRLAICAAGLERDHGLNRAAHGDARMSWRIAVPIAAWPARARFAQAPARAELRAYPVREKLRKRFTGRAHVEHVLGYDVEQTGAARGRVDDRAAQVISR